MKESNIIVQDPVRIAFLKPTEDYVDDVTPLQIIVGLGLPEFKFVLNDSKGINLITTINGYKINMHPDFIRVHVFGQASTYLIKGPKTNKVIASIHFAPTGFHFSSDVAHTMSYVFRQKPRLTFELTIKDQLLFDSILSRTP